MKFEPGTKVEVTIGAVVRELGDNGTVMGDFFRVDAVVLADREDKEVTGFVRVKIDGRDGVFVIKEDRIRTPPEPHDPANCFTCDHENPDRYDFV